MNENFPVIFLVSLGALSLIFGFGGDCFNFALGFSGRRAQREQKLGRHVSPVMLAPILANCFGLMLICLALRLPLLWFVCGVVFIVLFHLLGLAFCGR